jgi:hypothetical protein
VTAIVRSNFSDDGSNSKSEEKGLYIRDVVQTTVAAECTGASHSYICHWASAPKSRVSGWGPGDAKLMKGLNAYLTLSSIITSAGERKGLVEAKT